MISGFEHTLRFHFRGVLSGDDFANTKQITRLSEPHDHLILIAHQELFRDLFTH